MQGNTDAGMCQMYFYMLAPEGVGPPPTMGEGEWGAALPLLCGIIPLAPDNSHMSRGCCAACLLRCTPFACLAGGCRTANSTCCCSAARLQRNKLSSCWPAPPLLLPCPAGSKRFDSPTYAGIALDWCLEWETVCGQPAADYWCTLQGYTHAQELGGPVRLTEGEVATVLPKSNATCSPAIHQCDTFSYVVCATIA